MSDVEYCIIDYDDRVVFRLGDRDNANLFIPYIAEVVGTHNVVLIPSVYNDYMCCSKEDYGKYHTDSVIMNNQIMVNESRLPGSVNLNLLRYIKMSDADFDDFLEQCAGQETKVIGMRIRHKYWKMDKTLDDYIKFE